MPRIPRLFSSVSDTPSLSYRQSCTCFIQFGLPLLLVSLVWLHFVVKSWKKKKKRWLTVVRKYFCFFKWLHPFTSMHPSFSPFFILAPFRWFASLIHWIQRRWFGNVWQTRQQSSFLLLPHFVLFLWHSQCITIMAPLLTFPVFIFFKTMLTKEPWQSLTLPDTRSLMRTRAFPGWQGHWVISKP